MFYTVIRADEPNDLIKAVQVSIDHGWEPLGGIVYGSVRGFDVWYPMWAQAMIKRDKPAESK